MKIVSNDMESLIHSLILTIPYKVTVDSGFKNNRIFFNFDDLFNVEYFAYRS